MVKNLCWFDCPSCKHLVVVQKRLDRKYCSNRCKDREEKRRRRARQLARNPIANTHCLVCSQPFSSLSYVRKYCSKPCRRKMDVIRATESQRAIHERAIHERAQASKVCCDCGKIGLAKFQKKRCSACSKVNRNLSASADQHSMRKTQSVLRQEYQQLLSNAEYIDMRGFIRLQALSEMFGRDIEEWVNSVPRLAELQARLTEERQSYDLIKLKKYKEVKTNGD